MKIGIIGIGVIGSATAKVLGKTHQIYLYDKFKAEYRSIKNINNIAKNAEIVFLCLPTPMKANKTIDLSYIHDGCLKLLQSAIKNNRDPEEILIIMRSTAVPGTTDMLIKMYPFKFASNPEFLREKYALEDMKNPDRIVIGVNEKELMDKVLKIFKPLFPKKPYVLVDCKTSEMIKYSSNIMLASQISLANEIYNVCKILGISYDKVKEGMLLDQRIGRNINVPGHDEDFGFGGKCFPKDVNAFIKFAKERGYSPDLLEEVWRLNEKVRKNKDWLQISGAVSKKRFKKNRK